MAKKSTFSGPLDHFCRICQGNANVVSLTANTTLTVDMLTQEKY